MTDDLNKTHFQTFHQPYFSFKILKEQKTTQEIDELKAVFKKTWQEFKSWQEKALILSNLPFKKIRVESWTNGWNLRNHFWCPYRTEEAGKLAPCLAVMLDGEKVTVYLMYQHYKSGGTPLLIADYNQLYKTLPQWFETTTHKAPCYIWKAHQEKLTDFHKIIQVKDFETFKANIDFTTETFCLGYVFDVPQKDIPQTIATSLQTLWPLYESLLQHFYAK